MQDIMSPFKGQLAEARPLTARMLNEFKGKDDMYGTLQIGDKLLYLMIAENDETLSVRRLAHTNIKLLVEEYDFVRMANNGQSQMPIFIEKINE